MIDGQSRRRVGLIASIFVILSIAALTIGAHGSRPTALAASSHGAKATATAGKTKNSINLGGAVTPVSVPITGGGGTSAAPTPASGGTGTSSGLPITGAAPYPPVSPLPYALLGVVLLTTGILIRTRLR